MSLTVDSVTLEKAAAGDLSDDDFEVLIAESLPWAHRAIWEAIARWQVADVMDIRIHAAVPPSAVQRAELLRLMASTSMREYMERQYSVSLGFINCHYVVVGAAGVKDSPEWQTAVSPTNQVLMQRPELVDC